MKIFLLFYMCHFDMGITHCYKTTVFFTFIQITMELFHRPYDILWELAFYLHKILGASPLRIFVTDNLPNSGLTRLFAKYVGNYNEPV